MKIIKLIPLLIFVIQLSSCHKEPPDTFGTYNIINTSNHSVGLHFFLRGTQNDTIFMIETGGEWSYTGSARGGIGNPPPFPSDSVRMTYDDSVTIMHYRTADQEALRSILLPDSWSGGKVEEYKYVWEYIFTDADYEEALENQ